MNISITPFFTNKIELVSDEQQDYFDIAVTNLAKFGTYDSMDGNYIFIVEAETKDELDEKTSDLMCMFDELCEIRVYDNNSNVVTGIDFNGIDVNNHINYQNAWNDALRAEIVNNGTTNQLDAIVGEIMIGYVDEDDRQMVAFFNTLETCLNSVNSIYEDEDDVKTTLSKNTAELSGELKDIIEGIGEDIYGPLVVMPLTFANKFYDTETLEF
ncbi:hypothetical protein L1267_12380 [Pseudoalteromonas sp. OFAV1]|uniref:hypothetical protein n=1 Tax=Pseudoalteromonas sp. OFAV1 TaxID=2908892 RepID=UPI001F30408B|nr:hypothetical protein [Pseudoalteromonas sp. OFAV1]MCF2901189.1 hypothetical protein [Pseudoalteromonas sp. OFAV1]